MNTKPNLGGPVMVIRAARGARLPDLRELVREMVEADLRGGQP